MRLLFTAAATAAAAVLVAATGAAAAMAPFAAECPSVYLAEYGAAHAAYVRQFRDAADGEWDAGPRPPALQLNGTLIYYSRGGGFGNRVRAWTTLFYLAVLLRRAFFVHWPEPTVVDTYWEPTAWFDWRLSAAPPALRRAVHTALDRPHHWRPVGDRAGAWDPRAFFASTDFAAVLTHEHEAVTLIHDGAPLLLRNPHLAAATDRWLGDLQGAHAASGQPDALLRGRLFACAWHLMVQRTAHLDAVAARAVAQWLAPASEWRRNATGAAAAIDTADDGAASWPAGPPASATFPVAIHLRFGDQAALPTTEAMRRQLAVHLYAALAAARLAGVPTAPIFVATDHPTLVMQWAPPALASHVYAQRLAPNLTMATGMHVNVHPTAAGVERAMVDFALLADAAVLVLDLQSSFSIAAARWSWLAPDRNQTVYRIEPCRNRVAAQQHLACPVVHFSKQTAALPTTAGSAG